MNMQYVQLLCGLRTHRNTGSLEMDTRIHEALQECVYCGSNYDVQPHWSHTAYCWDGKGWDPNGPTWLCPACRLQDDDYWNEMWNDAYGGICEYMSTTS